MNNEDEPTQAALSDEEVLALALKTPGHFKTLINRYEAAFLRRARKIIGPCEEVEDVVVETFTKIYLAAARFQSRPGASFRSWAYAILQNTACSYYRRLQRDRRAVTLLADENALPVGADLWEERYALQTAVWLAVSRLPARAGRWLRRYFLEGWSQRQIAEAEGLTVAAVKTGLHRAKLELKKVLLAQSVSIYHQK